MIRTRGALIAGILLIILMGLFLVTFVLLPALANR
jgi:hypothetical protein